MGNFEDGEIKGEGQLKIKNNRHTVEVEGLFKDNLNLQKEGYIITEEGKRLITFTNGKIAKVI